MCHQQALKTGFGQLVSVSAHPATGSEADVNAGGPALEWETPCRVSTACLGARSQPDPPWACPGTRCWARAPRGGCGQAVAEILKGALGWQLHSGLQSCSAGPFPCSRRAVVTCAAVRCRLGDRGHGHGTLGLNSFCSTSALQLNIPTLSLCPKMHLIQMFD